VLVAELSDLIWLFEDEPESRQEEPWPIGLHTFRLARGNQAVKFSVDPIAGDAYISLYADDREIASVERIRRIEHLTIEKQDGYEGLQITFRGDYLDRLRLQTRPVIRLSWAVRPSGRW
jgi:hypothetical protein